MCGPSSSETSIAGQEQGLSSLLNANYGQQFGKQSALYSNLTSALEPIFDAGANQKGWSAEENAAITGNTINTNAANYKHAAAAVAAGEAGAGGATYAPTGGQQQVAGQIATAAAENLSAQENQNEIQNYSQGRQNFLNAESGLMGVAAGENPLGYAGAATGSNQAAFGEAQANQQASNAWVGDVTGLIGGLGGAAITAFCPAEGSLYLMADGTEKLVEDLVVGDLIMGIDGDYQTIEEIQSALTEIIQVVTENGCITNNSPTHAFALPYGGFVVSARSLGKKVVTANGNSRVIDITPAGEARVFNVITDGSHTYRADGVWALGVGDAERYVSMAEWKKIGDRIMKVVA